MVRVLGPAGAFEAQPAVRGNATSIIMSKLKITHFSLINIFLLKKILASLT